MKNPLNRTKLRRFLDSALFRVIGIFCLVVLTGFILYRTGALGFLTRGKTEESGGALSAGDFPDMMRAAEDAGELLYYSVPTEDILKNLVPVTSYTREIRSVRVFGSQYAEQYCTLTVDGDCWRLECGDTETFCDGEKVYTRTPTYAMVSEARDYYADVGITPLSRLIREADDPSLSTLILPNERTVRVQIVNPESGVIDQYEISIESGIILTETSAYGGNVYRNITTRLLAVRYGQPETDYKALVRDFLEQYGDSLSS